MYFFAERFQIKRKVMSAEEYSDISENNNNDEELIEIEDVPGVVLHPQLVCFVL